MIAGSKHDRNRQAMVLVLGGTPSFSPVTAVTGVGVTRWDLGDGTVLPNSASFTHVYADTNIYTVRAWRRYMKQFTSLIIDNDDLRSVDISGLEGLGGNTTGSIVLRDNFNLTTVKFPDKHTATGFVTLIEIDTCDITGPVNLNGLKNVSGVIRAFLNPNMTSFTADQPITPGGGVSTFDIRQCNSLVTVDVTGIVGLRGTINFRNCPQLNAFLVPNNIGVSTGDVTTFQGFQCSNLTTLGLGNFENVGGAFSMYQCPSLGFITFPVSPTAKMGTFRVEQCNILTLDISQYDLNGQIRFQTNPNLTSFQAPTVAGGDSCNIFWGYNCNLTGVLDLTSMVNLSGSILIYNNTAMTGVTFEGTAKPLNTSNLQIYNCDLTGTLDISMFTGLSGRVYLHSNSNLTAITNPTSAGVFTEYHAYSCNLTGTLDLSGLTGLGGSVELFINSNLTGITVPVSTQYFSQWLAYNCDLTGTLDLTGLTGGFRVFQVYNNPNLNGITFDPAYNNVTSDVVSWRMENCDLTGTLDLSPVNRFGGTFWAFNNPNLTGITFPTSSVAVSDMRVSSCGLTSVDFSPLSGFAGRIEFDGNALTSVTFPTVSAAFTNFFFSQNASLGYIDLTPLTGSTFSSVTVNNNGMTTAEVNQMLVEFDGMVGVVGSGTFNINNNSAPDGSSGGYDGLTAKSNLQAKGWTVNTD